MAVARPLYKVDHSMSDADTIRSLQIRLLEERQLRKAAERNARNFHALLIAERVKHLPSNTNGGARTSLDGSSASTPIRRVTQ